MNTLLFLAAASGGGLLLGLLNLILYILVIVLVIWLIHWLVVDVLGAPAKVGQIIIAIGVVLVIIALVSWLFGIGPAFPAMVR